MDKPLLSLDKPIRKSGPKTLIKTFLTIFILLLKLGLYLIYLHNIYVNRKSFISRQILE